MISNGGREWKDMQQNCTPTIFIRSLLHFLNKTEHKKSILHDAATMWSISQISLPSFVVMM